MGLGDIKNRLDEVKRQLDEVKRTSDFDNPGQLHLDENDLLAKNPYKSKYKNSNETIVLVGPIFISGVVGIEEKESISKMPVYNYAGRYFDSVLDGKYIMNGTLYVFEERTAKLQSDIAKYLALLKEDGVRRERIKEIVAQRNNLLGATIEAQLIKRYGAAKAAELAKQALSKINTEIISGHDWDVPVLTIVSGNISDPDPVVEVYNDIKFIGTSKSIVADGATQIRTYNFIGRKRQVRDKPLLVVTSRNWIVDVETTIINAARALVNRMKDSFRVEIEEKPIDYPITPNNIVFSGALPEVITTWGPKIDMSRIRVSQYGLDSLAATSFSVELYRVPKEIDEETANIKLRNNLPSSVDEFEHSNEVVTVDISNLWKYVYPDPNYLLASTAFISRSIPSTIAMAYSWLLPLPVIAGTDADIADAVKTDDRGTILSVASAASYTYKEEDEYPVTGSTLTWAFVDVQMSLSFDLSYRMKVRDPIRGMSYVASPKLMKDKSGDKSVVSLVDLLPVPISVIHRVSDAGEIYPDLLRDKRLLLAKHFPDIVVDESGTYVEPAPETEEIEEVKDTQVVKDTVPDAGNILSRTGYAAEEWFVCVPGGLVGMIIGGTSGAVADLLEIVTLGLIGNIDKANIYTTDLTSFDTINWESSVSNICVQVFPIMADKEDADRAISFLGGWELLTNDILQIRRPDAVALMNNCECIKGGDINYIVSLFGFNNNTDRKRMKLSVGWKKEVVEKAFKKEKYPMCLVRVFSEPYTVPRRTEIEPFVNGMEFVSQVTTDPSCRVVLDYVIRKDRNYIEQRGTWLDNFFNKAAEIWANYPNLNSDSAESVAEGMRMYTVSNTLMENDGAFRRLAVAGAGIGTVVGARVTDTAASAVIETARLIGIGGTMAINSIREIKNLALSLPLISQTADVLGALGIDLKGFMSDSAVVASDETTPKTKMSRFATYSNGERYIIKMDDVIDKYTDKVYKAISLHAKLRGAVIPGASNGSETFTEVEVKDKLDTAIRTAFADIFQINENLGGSEKWELVRFKDYYILTRRATKPSQFVLDSAIRKPEDYESEPEKPRGYVL